MRHYLHVLVSIGAAAVLASSGSSQVIYTYWGTASAGPTNPAMLTAWNAGDMDGDGADDMWVYTRGNGPTLTLFSVATGTILHTFGYNPLCYDRVTSGRDVDGDGWPDYA